MKRFFALTLIASLLLSLAAVSRASEPFRGRYYCASAGITMVLDIGRDSLLAPGFEFLGPMGGYMVGDTDEKLYGTWMLLSQRIDGNRALLRMTNDIGSDAQNILFTQVSDSVFAYKTQGGNDVKKAINHKLFKIESEMTFRLISSDPYSKE